MQCRKGLSVTYRFRLLPTGEFMLAGSRVLMRDAIPCLSTSTVGAIEQPVAAAAGLWRSVPGLRD